MTTDKWIQKAINPDNKGKLHRALNVSPDKKISEKKLDKAMNSKSPTLRREANLAKTLSKISRKRKK